MSSKRKMMYDSPLRQLTLKLIADWFDNEVYLNRAEYKSGKSKRRIEVDIPEDKLRQVDPLAQAKRDRPELWNTTFKRKYEAEDAKGNPIIKTEEISILDTYGPGPQATRLANRGGGPTTGHIATEAAVSRSAIAAENRRIREHVENVRRMQRAMRHLHEFAPIPALCIRLHSAGYSQSHISDKNRLDCSKSEVQKYFECGVTWLMGCVYKNPVWREDLPAFREVLREYHRQPSIPTMHEADLFGISDALVEERATAREV